MNSNVWTNATINLCHKRIKMLLWLKIIFLLRRSLLLLDVFTEETSLFHRSEWKVQEETTFISWGENNKLKICFLSMKWIKHNDICLDSVLCVKHLLRVNLHHNTKLYTMFNIAHLTKFFLSKLRTKKTFVLQYNNQGQMQSSLSWTASMTGPKVTVAAVGHFRRPNF